MTIQTLRVNNNRIRPTNDALSGSLIKISNDEKNSIKVVDDGLFANSNVIKGHTTSYLYNFESEFKPLEEVNILFRINEKNIVESNLNSSFSVIDVSKLNLISISNVSCNFGVINNNYTINSPNESECVSEFLDDKIKNIHVRTNSPRYIEDGPVYTNHINSDYSEDKLLQNNTQYDQVQIEEILEGSRYIRFTKYSPTMYLKVFTQDTSESPTIENSSGGIVGYPYHINESILRPFIGGQKVTVNLYDNMFENLLYTLNYTVQKSNIDVDVVKEGDTIVKGVVPDINSVVTIFVKGDKEYTTTSDENGNFEVVTSPLISYTPISVNGKYVVYVESKLEQYFEVSVSGYRYIEEYDVNYMEATVSTMNTKPNVLEKSIPLNSLNNSGEYVLTEPDSWIKVGDNYIPSYTLNTITN